MGGYGQREVGGHTGLDEEGRVMQGGEVRWSSE